MSGEKRFYDFNGPSAPPPRPYPTIFEKPIPNLPTYSRTTWGCVQSSYLVNCVLLTITEQNVLYNRSFLNLMTTVPTSPNAFLKNEIQKLFGSPPLQVELVPRTCWFSNVRKNIRSAEWDKLRKATYQKAGHICEICGGQGSRWPVECHEIWHYDDENLTQTLRGLIALCPSCHEVKHIGLATLHGRGQIAQSHLEKINGWTEEQSKTYLELVTAIWVERSKHQWELNGIWLQQFGIRIRQKDAEAEQNLQLKLMASTDNESI